MKLKTYGYGVLLFSLVICQAAAAAPLRAKVTQSQAQAPTVLSQRPLSTQFERIYLSSAGELLGAHIVISRTVLYVDTAGRLSLSARDYTAELGYDYKGQLNRIGNTEIAYDYIGRIQQIGSTLIAYGYSGKIARIGQAAIAYTARGKVAQIGDVTIQYDRSAIDTISSNYTSAGARIIIINHKARL